MGDPGDQRIWSTRPPPPSPRNNVVIQNLETALAEEGRGVERRGMKTKKI